MIIRMLTLDYPPHRYIGAELANHALAKHLIDSGHTVTVETVHNRRHSFEGVSVTPVAANAPAGADLVIATGGLAALARKRYPTSPLAVYAHNARLDVVVDIRGALMNTRGPAMVIANTQHAADVFHTVIGVDRPAVLYPSPRVTPDQIDPEAKPGRGVGLVNPIADKGAHLFYDVAALAPSLAFHTLGGGYGNAITPAVENVTHHPHGDDGAAAFWQAVGVLLIPSRHESFSMVGLEAQARGIPTIATDHPGVREALAPGGVMLAPGADDREWLAALASVSGRKLTKAIRDRAISNAADVAARREVQLDTVRHQLEGFGR